MLPCLPYFPRSHSLPPLSSRSKTNHCKVTCSFKLSPYLRGKSCEHGLRMYENHLESESLFWIHLPHRFQFEATKSHLVCSISQIDAIADDASWYGCRHNDDISTYLISDRILSWLAQKVGNEGPSTFTNWYIGDETSLIPYESGQLENTDRLFFHIESYPSGPFWSDSFGGPYLPGSVRMLKIHQTFARLVEFPTETVSKSTGI